MKDFNRSLFIDTSRIEFVKQWNRTGVIDGVTTNQYIMLSDGVHPKDFDKTVKTICKEMKQKPVSIELSDSTASEEDMIKEAKRLNSIAENIVIKVPLIPDTTKSLTVIYELAKLDIAVNVTTLMTYEQLVMATLATRHCKRPSFISFFWGRSAEDHTNYRCRSDFMAQYPRVGLESKINSSPKSITESISTFLQEGKYANPKIIVGSIRTASMVGEAFAAGAHIVTTTPEILINLLFSQRTIETIAQFDDAWKTMQAKK